MAQFYLIYILIPLLAGALLDFLFGDPLNRFHPVVLIGRLISRAERRFYINNEAVNNHPAKGRDGAAPRGDRPSTGEEPPLDESPRAEKLPLPDESPGMEELSPPGEPPRTEELPPMGEPSGAEELAGRDRRSAANRKAGVWTVVLVCLASVLIPTALIAGLSGLVRLVSPAAGRVVASALCTLLCWQMLAAKGLETESMKVYDALWPAPARDTADGTAVSPESVPGSGTSPAADQQPFCSGGEDRLPEARRALSMIVGRDTESLDEQGVIRAAVETVAENTCDGVIAPMLFMAVLGIPGIMLYKAVNTMDSMIGYKNEKYLDFGRAAARTDDALNFIPARISGLSLIMAAFLHRECDGRNAWKVFREDRRKSSSPNAGCGEAAAAGALHVRLLGPASYFGVWQEKPYIGSDDRPAEREDIRIAGELMYMASGITLLAVTIVFLLCSAL